MPRLYDFDDLTLQNADYQAERQLHVREEHQR